MCRFGLLTLFVVRFGCHGGRLLCCFMWLICLLHVQVIINFNALPWLLNLLSSSKKGIRKEACWTISNITAGNKEQIQAVIEANIIPPLIQLLSNAEFDIRKVRQRALLCTAAVLGRDRSAPVSVLRPRLAALRDA